LLTCLDKQKLGLHFTQDFSLQALFLQMLQIGLVLQIFFFLNDLYTLGNFISIRV